MKRVLDVCFESMMHRDFAGRQSVIVGYLGPAFADQGAKARVRVKAKEDRRERLLGLFLDREEKLELGGELIFGIQSVREVDTADSTVGMDLDAKGLDVVCAVCAPREVRQVELNLVPAFVEPHRHCTDEGLHSSC